MANETYGVTIASDASKIKADLAALYGALGQAASGFTQNTAAAKKLEAAWATAGNRAKTAATQIQRMTMHTTNLTYQLNDIAVMMAAGQNPFLLMMQQGTQINQIWEQMTHGIEGVGNKAKAIGSAISASVASLISVQNLLTLAVIGGSAALVNWIFHTKEGKKEADSFTNSVKALTGAIESQNKTLLARTIGVENADYAAVLERILDLENERNALLEERAAIPLGYEFSATALKIANDKLAKTEKELAALRKIASEWREVDNTTKNIDDTLKRNAERIKEMFDGIESMKLKIDDAVLSLGEMPSILDLAIARAGRLGSELYAAGMALTNAYNSGLALDAFGGAGDWKYSDPSTFKPPTARKKGGGGGGAKTNPLIEDLTAVREALQSETEAQLAAYAEQQEILQQALAQRLLTQEEYQRLMEESRLQHYDKMADLDVWHYGSGLEKAGQWFGDMADAMQNGNEKMLRVGKVFGAAQALVNSWLAFSQVLSDPTLPFFAKIPAALSVLSAGFGAVNAIRGLSKSGGSTTPGATASTPSISRNVLIELTGGPMYSKGQVKDLINSINEAIEDGATLRLA